MNSLLPLIRRHTLGDWVYDFDRFLEPTLEDSSFNLSGDIEETDKHILMSFDVPGMKEGDFNVQVKENILILSGERKKEIKEENKEGYKFYGRRYGKFNRQFSLPKTIDASNIEADYQDGVLRIVLPKIEPEKPNVIDVKVGNKRFI